MVRIPLSTESIERIYPKPLRGSRRPVVFGYVGGIGISRGYEVLVDAFSRLDQNAAKLIVWGAPSAGLLDGKLNIEMRRPYRPEDLNRVFKEIDVGIIPSVWEEAFGIIGVEWLTARIPVIGSDIGGIPDWLQDGKNGFLTAPRDAGQLAGKMELFTKDPGLIAGMQRRVKPWVRISQHADEMARLYNRLIKSRR